MREQDHAPQGSVIRAASGRALRGKRAQRLQIHEVLRAPGGGLRANEIFEAQDLYGHAVEIRVDAAKRDVVVVAEAGDLAEEIEISEIGREREVEPVPEGSIVPEEREIGGRASQMRV